MPETKPDTESDSPTADVVSVERLIPVPADQIFALLADPTRHCEFDGSGTVRQAKGESRQLALGDVFGMSMFMLVPYAMRSKVVEFEQDRLLAWQTLPPYRFVDPFAGGRIWRYELEPHPEGGTLVRESWDIRKESPLTRPLVRQAAAKTRVAMERTLERIEKLLA